MSNRRRNPRPYRSRKPGRSPAARSPRRWPQVLRPGRGVPWLAGALAVAAEFGHLAAAVVEWPDSTTRGVYHVLAGAVLGVVAAGALAGPSRARLAAGAVAVTAAPLVWLGTVVAGGASPYALLPMPAAAGIVTGELAVAALLLGGWAAARPVVSAAR